MMGDIDWFGTIFGAVPEGEISWNARVAKAMIRAGLAPVLIQPNDKRAICTLKVADAKKADVAAQDAAKASGNPRWDKVTHDCGHKHALTDEKQLNHKRVKELLEDGANLAVSFEHNTRRVIVVDVDTDAERCAFLDDWLTAAVNGNDQGPLKWPDGPGHPLTVTSPGVYANETWKHRDGGHIWFDVADDVELPDTKGKAKWCGCHQFSLPSCEKAWQMFWGTGYVLVPPSVRPEGPYRVTGEVLQAPAWLLEIARESVNVTAACSSTGELNIDDGDPINSWSSQTPWATLLTEDGWTEWSTDNCGCPTWTLPGGASNPKSATAHEVGCGRVSSDGGHAPLHIWSDALRPGGKDTLTKLSYVTHMRHGGDVGAAKDALGIARGTSTYNDNDDPFVLGKSPGKAQAPAPGATDGEKGEDIVRVPDVTAFWDTRQTLRNIHDLAWSEMCAPWAVLGAVLSYVTALTPPRVRVNNMSLNLFVGLVGPPGSGKDTAIRAARKWIGDLARDDRLYQRSIGSGQGLESAFVNRVKEKAEDGESSYVNKQIRENVLVKVSEVDQITSHARQQASTLVANLRSAYMAQGLGGMYKDTTKDIAVGEDTYRLSMIVNIQPSRAKALLDDASGGLPQRFLWLPTTDQTMPRNFREFRPEPMEWKPPVKCRDMSDPFVIGEEAHHDPNVEMSVCQKARDEIDEGRYARATGTWDGDAMSTHDDLGRLKVAAALALLEGRTDVRDEDWDLAGTMAQVSKFVRGRVIHSLEAEDRQRKEAEKVQRVEVEVAVEKAKTSTALERVKARILQVLLENRGEYMPAGKLRKCLTSTARAHFEDATAELTRSGQVECLEESGVSRFRTTRS